MIINKINCLNYNTYPLYSRKDTETTGSLGVQKEQIKEFNPHSYMDFNINFGARLWRSPENFYAQTFNQENMPKTMKDYLYDDFEDRQHMPPAQVMKTVFGDLKDAKSLQEAKEMYPDEPLFKNLHDIDYSNYRAGTLLDIRILKDDKHPLFKDGSDDLGLYLLRKIYVECKSKREIVKDFRNDLDDYYKEVADIDYNTINSFGIGFPNRSFWHSLSATREEFPYEYKPRKAIQSRAGAGNHTEHTDKAEDKKRIRKPGKPKYNIEDHELKKMTDAILDGGGNLEETERALKKRGFRGKDEGKKSFVCQYLGPIMSITLDRIQASEEMREFFEDYDTKNTSMKRRMNDYWKSHPGMKELQSRVMSETIKEFFTAYGADGNNDYFQDLLDYAASIKPFRNQRKAEEKEREARHNQMQQYYDDLFAEIDANEKKDNQTETTETNEKPVDAATDRRDEEALRQFMALQNILRELIGPNNAEPCKFEVDGVVYDLQFNPKNEYVNYLQNYRFPKALPDRWFQKFIKYSCDNISNKNLISIVKHTSLRQIPIDKEKLNSVDEAAEATAILDSDFEKTHSKETYAALAAIMIEYYNKTQNIDDIRKLFESRHPLNIFAKFRDLLREKELEDKMDKGNINAKYGELLKPLSSSETNKITVQLIKRIREYKPTGEDKDAVSAVTSAISIMAKSNDKNSRDFRSSISQFVRNIYGGASRTMLDPNIPDEIKDELAMHVLNQYIFKNADEVKSFLRRNYSSTLIMNTAYNDYVKNNK